MQFRPSRTVPGEGFRKQELVQVAAFRNLKVDEELFVDYGAKFLF